MICESANYVQYLSVFDRFSFVTDLFWGRESDVVVLFHEELSGFCTQTKRRSVQQMESVGVTLYMHYFDPVNALMGVHTPGPSDLPHSQPANCLPSGQHQKDQLGNYGLSHRQEYTCKA